MNSIARAALFKARHPAPAPAYSTETVRPRRKPIPVLVVQGPINHFMRMQARAEAIDMVQSLRATLNGTNGLVLVIEALKRTADGRPGSHVAGYLDVIQLLEQGNDHTKK